VNSYEEHLKITRHYLEEAYKLLERRDPYDAAEKIWAAVKHATITLTTAILREATPLKGVFKMALNAFEQMQLQETRTLYNFIYILLNISHYHLYSSLAM